MNFPVHVTLRGMAPSTALEEYIHRKAATLERFSRRIIRCRVTVEAPSRARAPSASRYKVRVDMIVPGDELVVGRHSLHQDVYASVDKAIDEAQRVLEDHERRRRQEVKHHEGTRHGRITKLFSDRDHGFLVTQEGEEILFHRNSVIEGEFDRLQVGDTVRFVATDDGRASTVAAAARHAGVERRARSR
jgi:ribosomal subunit interface protein